MRWENWPVIATRCGFRQEGDKFVYGRAGKNGALRIDVIDAGGLGTCARLVSGHDVTGTVLSSGFGESQDAAFSALLNSTIGPGGVSVSRIIGACMLCVEALAALRFFASRIVEAKREGME